MNIKENYYIQQIDTKDLFNETMNNMTIKFY